MSFLRHGEIYPSDGGAIVAGRAPAHRLDEFPAGYSSAVCSPAGTASASPAGSQDAVQSYCRSRIFHRTVNSVLTGCLTPGDKRRPMPQVLDSVLPHPTPPTRTCHARVGIRMIFFWMAYCTNWALLWMSSLRMRLNL